MPVDLTISDVPTELYVLLKKQAHRNKRSLNSEIISCLGKEVQGNPIDPDRYIRLAKELKEDRGEVMSMEEIIQFLESDRL